MHGDDAVIQREPSFRKWGDDEAQVVGIRNAVVNIKAGQRDEVCPRFGACLMDHSDGHVVFTTAFEGEIRKRQTDVPAWREAVRCPNGTPAEREALVPNRAVLVRVMFHDDVVWVEDASEAQGRRPRP